VVFPWLLTKYLCDLNGETTADGGKRRYNFVAGAEVAVPVRGLGAERGIRLEGPGVSAEKSGFTVPADATTLRLRNKPPADAPRGNTGPEVWELDGNPLLTPGAFALRPDGGESPWRFRFSVGVPPAESDLQQVPPATIADLFGPDRVISLDRKAPLRDYVEAKLTRPFELFPALVIGVLIFFAFEGLMANRFYKLK
jgi:hypothetical protein